MTPEHYLNFIRYNAWANRRVAEMLELTGEQLQPSLRLFSHLLRAERVWLGRVQGTEDAALPIWGTDTLTLCRETIEVNTAAFKRMVSSLTSDDLARTVSYTNSQDIPCSTAIHDILSHVFNHGAHHRGQIALLVREAGQVPAPLDFIAYIREKDR